MSLVDLSLDEIIARQKQKKGGAKRLETSAWTRPRQRGRGFVPKYDSPDSAFTKSKDVPQGKWGHDGFEEMYGGGGSQKKPSKLRAGGRTFGRSALSSKVTIHITNLAPTVTTEDLNELLEEYALESAVVNYDAVGESTGTADIITDRASAEEITANFSGVAIDGRMMRMFLIDENEVTGTSRPFNIMQRLSFRSAPRSRGINKRTDRPLFRAGNRRAAKGGGRGGWKGGVGRKEGDKRKKMTEEELDRELDEYMKKGANTHMEA